MLYTIKIVIYVLYLTAENIYFKNAPFGSALIIIWF